MRASHSGLVHLPSKQDFVGSNPIARSDETTPSLHCNGSTWCKRNYRISKTLDNRFPLGLYRTTDHLVYVGVV